MKPKQIVLGRDENGKQIRKRIYGETKMDIAMNEAAARLEFAKGHNPSLVTFKEYSEQWLQTYKCNRGINTIEMYNNTFKKFASINHRKITDITQTDLQKIIAANSDKPGSCEKIRLTLRQIFKAAVNDGIITKNPADDLEIPKKPKVVHFALDDDQKKALDELNLADMDRMYLLCLRNFGLRPEEARALTAAKFDLKKRTVVIDQAIIFDKNNAVLKSTKTDNVRVLPIPDALLPELESYLVELKTDYLFTKRDGHPLTHSSNVKLWNRIRTALCVKLYGNDNDENMSRLSGFTPYVFRRAYATQLYYSGISLKKAAQLMGHADTNMIIKIYAQLDEERENLDQLRSIKF